MASSTKLSFRARNLDANKPMAVYFVDELPDLSEVAPINRAVAQMPTGMEKDEEMESHLQDAILAQQASTSGVAVENHVIPTPKVHPVENDRHRETYQVQPQCPNNLIRVQAWRTLDQEEPSYDIDSDDEQWLEKHPNVAARDLEKIFEVLEMRSSDNQICLPDAARSALSTYDENVIDDSYDYWLTKRKELTSKGLGAGGLIPRVRTEAKKDGTVNPYVAFRRRAEKMQTRKNRKNDEESYEKVLRIGHDLRRCVTLADLIKKREKMKSLLLEGELEIFRLQLELSDFDGSLTNHFMQSLKAETANGPLKEENGAPKKKLKKKKQRVVAVDREIPNKAWLKKNAEVWNMPPSMSGVFSGVSPIVEVDKSAATQEEEPDGPFVFRRRKHCIYRSARNSLLAPSEPSSSTRPLEDRFFQTEMPSKAGPLALGFTRRRLGRGGRVMFDRLVDVRNANRFDPFLQDCICDDSVSFRGVEAEPVETPSVSRSASPAFSDREQELAWMASARSPTPTEDDSMPSSRPSPSSPGNYHNGSGNGLMGRVGHTDEMVERVQMPDSKFCQETASCRTADEVTVTCETEMSANSDYWTAGDSSRSPSESNSSMDWTPPSAIHRGAPDIMSSFVMLSREEEKAARTGDHPRRQSKPAHSHHIAKSVVASTVEGILKHTLITPAPSVG